MALTSENFVDDSITAGRETIGNNSFLTYSHGYYYLCTYLSWHLATFIKKNCSAELMIIVF